MDAETIEETIDFTLQTAATEVSQEPEDKQKMIQEIADNPEKLYTTDSGFLMLHKDHPEFTSLFRLQLENLELVKWKEQLQGRINAERNECVRLKRLPSNESAVFHPTTSLNFDDPEYDKLVDHLTKENVLLEQKRNLLAKEIVDENISLIQLKCELAMKLFID